MAAGAFLWFGGKSSLELWRYSHLTQLSKAEVTAWSVEKNGSSKFALKASYIFEVEGKKLSGETTFKNPFFLNPESAKAEGKKWACQSWSTWYSPTRPSFSSLERIFPYKSLLQAIISFVVFIYFFILKKYLMKISDLYQK